ncbi:MAG: EAL domain-containing protein [Myxococcales bacterium]|nr:EAL domain-containing protein [Myxococcales bacterium]
MRGDRGDSNAVSEPVTALVVGAAQDAELIAWLNELALIDVVLSEADPARAADRLTRGDVTLVVACGSNPQVVRALARRRDPGGAPVPVIEISDAAPWDSPAVARLARAGLTREELELITRMAVMLRDQATARAERDRWFSLMVQGVNDGLWMWERGRDEIYLSPRWCAVMRLGALEGYRPTSEWLDRVHVDDRATLRRILQPAPDTATRPRAVECEYRERTGDGAYRWVRLRGACERDEQGEVVRYAGSMTDIHGQKTSQLQYEHASFHDTLTGLPNRAFFIRQLRRVFREHQRGRAGRFAVLFLDLDRFKLINDSLGHDAGDVLLTSLSARLLPCVRAMDTVARIGGDEFALLLEALDSKRAAFDVAGRLLHALEQPFDVSGHQVVVSCSVGIAFPDEAYAHAEDLLRDADNALFAAKAAGGAEYRVFSPDMHSRSVSLLRTESEIRRGIDHGEFELHYQPIVELRTGRIASLEALIRWNSPGRGMVSPGEFIPVAEDTGLIIGLGRWVLHEACRFATRLVEVLGRKAAPAINVNVSRRQLRAAFVQEVREILDAFPLAAACLRLEITESVLMSEGHDDGPLKEIRAMGIELHIDDFGTGYSSLASLASMEVSGLKIDRSFIIKLGEDQKSALIVQTILSLAKSLSMKVTAEGIETAAQLRRLEQLDCGYGQGYLFSRPRPADEIFETLLRERSPRREPSRPLPAADQAAVE